MNAWSCVIPGKPRTKNRKHAVWRPGMKHARLIDHGPSKVAEENTRALMAMQKPAALFAGPVVQDVDFIFAIAESRRRDVKHRDGTVTKALQPGDLHDGRPDRGNLLKLLDDAMKGIIVGDDAQMADGRVRKLWGDIDETRVTVRAWERESVSHPAQTGEVSTTRDGAP